MSRHRAAPPGRRPPAPPNRHRAAPRPRLGRIVVLGSSVAVTAVAMLGGIGVLPSVAHDGPESSVAEDVTNPRVAQLAGTSQVSAGGESEAPATEGEPTPTSQSETEPDDEDLSPPADSGDGRRVVFSEGRQRVWLVDEDGTAERTYLVSGSIHDNLDPGTYEVYSRSEVAQGIDASGTMNWFVRFTKGDTGAAIGFHDIPVVDGVPVQTTAELGTAQSHGCIRQASEDAVALWEFAPIGTVVVVTA